MVVIVFFYNLYNFPHSLDLVTFAIVHKKLSMFYLLIFAILFIEELLYFRIANSFNIIDRPNERSSHNYITIRGGGVIYWVAALLYLIYNFSYEGLLFFVGITLIAGISFWDDVKYLRQSVRLLFHMLVMSCAFYLTGVFGGVPWWTIVIGYIVFIGIVNAYNFMDGINGITGLYSLAVLGSLQYMNLAYGNFVNADLIWFPMIASVVFLFFNLGGGRSVLRVMWVVGLSLFGL